MCRNSVVSSYSATGKFYVSAITDGVMNIYWFSLLSWPLGLFGGAPRNQRKSENP